MNTKDALHSGDPILELRNVSTSFGPVNVIEDVSVGVYPGQVQGLPVWWIQSPDSVHSEGLNFSTNLLPAVSHTETIFAGHKEMVLNVFQAWGDKAKKDVVAVDFGVTERASADMEHGHSVATIAQQPRELGAKAVEEAAKLLSGESVESEVPVEVVTVTKENVGEFK